jgi:hypothetical protein
MKNVRTRSVSLSALALGLLGIVLASAAASAETVVGCKNPAGILRIVDASTPCRPGETLVELATPTPSSGITRVVHGSIGSDGSILFDSSGFSVERGAEGNYHVVFDVPFEGTPTCTLTSYSIAECKLNVFGTPGIFKTAEGFRVVCDLPQLSGTTIVFASADASFDFVCVE